jgi:hypothetical protein
VHDRQIANLRVFLARAQPHHRTCGSASCAIRLPKIVDTMTGNPAPLSIAKIARDRDSV